MYLISKRYIGSADISVARKLFESCPKVARKLPRDINTEMVTKIVPVRAVDLSIGPFCTEFRCERFCDVAVFQKIENLAGSCRFSSAGSRFVSVRAGSGLAAPVRFVVTLLDAILAEIVA